MGEVIQGIQEKRRGKGKGKVGGEVFPTEGIICAKALRWGIIWHSKELKTAREREKERKLAPLCKYVYNFT